MIDEKEFIQFIDDLKYIDERLKNIEKRTQKNEDKINKLENSFSQSLIQVEQIAKDLKKTSENFKEAVMRSNIANEKETTIVKEKIKELTERIDKLNDRFEEETIIKDANTWKSIKKQALSWALNIILGIIALILGFSKLT